MGAVGDSEGSTFPGDSGAHPLKSRVPTITAPRITRRVTADSTDMPKRAWAREPGVMEIASLNE